MAEDNNSEKESVTFICDKCGECCRHLEPFLNIWPHQTNGLCNFLEGDLCSIYAKRPDFCNYERWSSYYIDNKSKK
ncbi:MAG: YkgJ family cysteine cluster protein, partial [Treponema sp.]|nr:YkgJ family cysteine cluster protein [Treponema sp.]